MRFAPGADAVGFFLAILHSWREEIARRGIRPAGRRFLPKPFTPAQFAERVREVLDSELT